MNFLTLILIVVLVIYVITLLVITGGYIKQRKKYKVVSNPSVSAKISVVIAARNEEATIEKCLSSIVSQGYNKGDYEIILVNDHSTDDTLKILERYSKEYNHLKYYSLDESFSKKEAIKFGVSKAKYEIIATTDADCKTPKNWLKLISTQFQNSSLLLGPVQLTQTKGFLGAFQELDMFSLQGFTFGSLAFNNPILINAANMVFKKEDHVHHTSLNEKTPSGDDMFLLEQLKINKKNITGILDTKFVVKTKAEKSFLDFFNQRIRWASKNKHYKDKSIQYFGVLIFLTNISLIFIYLHLVFVEQNRVVYIILLLTKWLIDFILLFLVSSFFKRRKVLTYFVPVQLIYPLYILVVGVLSSFFKIKWKGRVYNG